MIRISVSTSGASQEGVTVGIPNDADVSKGVLTGLILVGAMKHPRDGRAIIIRREP